MSLQDNSVSLEKILAMIPPPVKQATPVISVLGDGTITVTATQEAGKVKAGTKTVTAQGGARVASGTVTLSNKNSITITPGFAVKNLCIGGTATGYAQVSSGLYIDGKASGGISAVTTTGSSTVITLNGNRTGTYYWLATS